MGFETNYVPPKPITVDYRDKDGRTLVQLMALYQDLDLFHDGFLDRFSTEIINAKDADEFTALYYASNIEPEGPHVTRSHHEPDLGLIMELQRRRTA